MIVSVVCVPPKLASRHQSGPVHPPDQPRVGSDTTEIGKINVLSVCLRTLLKIYSYRYIHSGKHINQQTRQQTTKQDKQTTKQDKQTTKAHVTEDVSTFIGE